MQSENIDELAAALAKAQGEFPEIIRSKTVAVTTKTGGRYTFVYAPLEVIIAAVRPVLSANGLAIVQSIEAERVVTRLLHTSGQFISSGGTPILVTAEGAQAHGSALTYARRYDLTLLLALASEEDDDANQAEGNRAMPVAKGPGVHKPSDGADEALTPAQKLKVQGVVDEAMVCLVNSPLDALAVLEAAKFEVEESLYAWNFFSAPQRAAMKNAKAKLKNATPAQPPAA